MRCRQSGPPHDKLVSRKPGAVQFFGPEASPVGIDFLLLGHLNVPRFRAKTGRDGSILPAKADFMLHFWDLLDGSVEIGHRKLLVPESDAQGAMPDLFNEVARFVIGEIDPVGVIARWKRGISQGRKYHVAFCEKGLKDEYFFGLRSHLAGRGALSDVEWKYRPMRVFTFPRGQRVDPTHAFSAMLAEIQGRGEYTDTKVAPIFLGKHKVFVFGNAPRCFGS